MQTLLPSSVNLRLRCLIARKYARTLDIHTSRRHNIRGRTRIRATQRKGLGAGALQLRRGGLNSRLSKGVERPASATAGGECG